MNIAALKQSRYLTKEDFGQGKLVTIKGDLIAENVAKQDEPEEIKHLIFFEEYEKGMVLNSVNAQLIAKIVGSEETTNWAGHKIVCFHDPSVVMRGKLTGGVRVRAPKQRPAAPVAQAPRTPSGVRPHSPQPPRVNPTPAAPVASEPSDNDGWLPADEAASDDNIP